MAVTRTAVFNEEAGSLARKQDHARALLWFTLLTFILVTILFLINPVEAYGTSAHGPFSSSTDKCSGCHRMHDSQGPKLLSQPTPTSLCLSCHAKGQSADTAVLEGIYLDPQNAGHGWGSPNGTLLGGGFDYVGQVDAVTGEHALGTAASPYGRETDQVYALGCLDCHTPHQGPNYRLLRRRPGTAAGDIAVTWNGPWTDGSESIRGGDYAGYTVTDFGGAAGVQEYTRNYNDGIAEFCGACHQKYSTRHDVTDYNAGDTYGAADRFRHTVDKVITSNTPNPANGITYQLETSLPLEDKSANGHDTGDTMMCLTCHAAHGSAATMTGSANLSSGERGSLPAGANGMMLRLDDRNVCTACHSFDTSP